MNKNNIVELQHQLKKQCYWMSKQIKGSDCWYWQFNVCGSRLVRHMDFTRLCAANHAVSQWSLKNFAKEKWHWIEAKNSKQEGLMTLLTQNMVDSTISCHDIRGEYKRTRLFAIIFDACACPLQFTCLSAFPMLTVFFFLLSYIFGANRHLSCKDITK